MIDEGSEAGLDLQQIVQEAREGEFTMSCWAACNFNFETNNS